MSRSTMTRAEQIDALMDDASVALVETGYHRVLDLADRAMRLALAASDWERLSRICLPLQEARRQIRQEAVDAAAADCKIRLIDTPTQLRGPPAAGCYLIQPPLVGADARTFRFAAERKRVPVFVLAREPRTAKGLWPIVGVSSISVRTRIEPPNGAERTGDSAWFDLEWFEAGAEALGDAAIASVDQNDPAAHRVEDLLDRLAAVPEHEKLHQALAEAARQAMTEPPPNTPRRRGVDHPYSF